MNCVRCSREMDKRQERGVLVDHCSTCNAVWLDAGELEKLAVGAGESAQRLAQQSAAERRAEGRQPVQAAGLCPRCQRGLMATTLGGAELDLCPRCGGLFFDDGELPVVLTALRPNPLVAWWRRHRARRG